jgi:hypothetical protein
MERQVIERLAMDAALGELNEDAAALLEAYLTEHPETRLWAGPMTAICRRTQEAVVAKTRPAALSRLPCATGARQIVRVRLASVGRWAAVVIVSLVLGGAAGRWTMSPTELASRPTASAETVRSSAQRDWRAVLNRRDLGFWEAKAAAALQRQPSGGSYEPKPSPWEMLKQRQKERRHAL